MVLGLRNSGLLKTSKRILAVVCVLLVVFGATVQLTHAHADGKEIAHADCALCLSAHATPVAAAPPIVLVSASFLALIETPVVSERPIFELGFALFTRPPPVVSVSA